MPSSGATSATRERVEYRFADFTLDSRGGRLERAGSPVRVPAKSVDLLLLLLEQPGALVTRARIRSELWNGISVDFDSGINTVVRNLRRALHDDARCPRFVETVPRRGYRFVGEVTRRACAERSGADVAPVRTTGGETTGPEVDARRGAGGPARPAPPGTANARAGRGGDLAPRSRWRLAVLLGLPVAVLLLAVSATDRLPGGRNDLRTVVRYDFRTMATPPDRLAAAGLAILNPDLGAWTTADADGPLVLATHRGDFWRKAVDPEMPPRNIVALPLTERWYRVTARLSGFHPTGPWQQAGIVVLEDETAENYLRLTYGYICEGGGRTRGLSMVAEQRGRDIRYTACHPLTHSLDPLWLRIIRKGDEFLFEYKADREHRDWRILDFQVDPERFRFGQSHVAVAAFQGVSYDDLTPIDLPPATVAVDFLEIELLPGAAP